MPTGREIVASAEKHLGKRYVYGSKGPNTFDCSGLVLYVYREFGISLPHKANQQARRGKAVSVDDIQPGDLVFSDWGRGPNSHVGIAVSGNRIIDAPNKRSVVRYDNLSSSYRSHITAVRRFPGVTNAGGGAGTSGAQPGSSGATAPGTDTAGGDSGGGLLSPVADAIRQGLLPLTGTQTVADLLAGMFVPTVLVRLVCGIAGMVLVGWGTVLMAREVREA
jgi:hypothetical protein